MCSAVTFYSDFALVVDFEVRMEDYCFIFDLILGIGFGIPTENM